MPSSAVVTLSDPGEYAAAFRNAKVEITVTGPGQFTAELTSIDLHRLQMQRYHENLPRVLHWAGTSERAVIAFRTQPGPSLLWGGVEMLSSNLVRDGGESNFQRSPGPVSWAAMSLPLEDAVAIGETLAACDLTPPRDHLMVIPRPDAMAKLQRLHAAAGQLADDAPEIIANPDAARGLEQALTEAMVGCLRVGSVHEDAMAQRQHELIMRRFRRVLEEKPFESLYITDICKVIRVSERTLEVCCQEQLGLGPKRYLVLRRFHLARRALREAASDRTTVTDIATRYGFWHFGRFAGAYRSLFGESPSVTLHRQSESRRISLRKVDSAPLDRSGESSTGTDFRHPIKVPGWGCVRFLGGSRCTNCLYRLFGGLAAGLVLTGLPALVDQAQHPVHGRRHRLDAGRCLPPRRRAW